MNPEYLYNFGIDVLWISLIIYILQAIGLWKVFKKAGLPGWFSLIPFMNTYYIYKICWQTKIFWINLALSVLGAAIAWASGGFLFYLGVALGVVSMIIRAVLYYNLSLSFGHGFLYFLGLYFFSPIFLPLLGFSSAVYRGNRYQI